MNKFMGMAKKISFKTRKHSPEICVTLGTTCAIVSGFMLGRASLKVSGVLEESKKQLDQIHEVKNNPELKEKYTDKDARKDTTIVYAQTVVKCLKLFGPGIGLGALSIGLIMKGNGILKKRNAALAAAYAAVDKGFKEYRQRVVERFGDEVDKQLRFNLEPTEVKEKIVDEDGKTKTVKKTVGLVKDIDALRPYSPYARSYKIENDREYTMMFLRAQQNCWNDKLRADGFVFLNDVYESLGLPRTKAGQVVGWVYDPNNKSIDNYIDFGIYLARGEDEKAYIMLDFNVDGNIWEKM